MSSPVLSEQRVKILSEKESETDLCTAVSTKNAHVILDPKVPYVGQGNDSFCALASTAMQINYLGFNTTLPEILHDVGYGYLRMYYKFIPGVSRLASGGAGITQMDFSMHYIADAYNATFKDFSLMKIDTNTSLWEPYFEKVKELIDLDIPIQTGIDPYKLSFWQKHLNASNDTIGGHAIVLVGYSEENQSICFNDPYAQEVHLNGSYIWEDLTHFKYAVEGMNGFYKIYVFYQENHTKNPSRAERFVQVHEQNIQRLQGEFKYYFGVDVDPSNLPWFYRLLFTSCYHIGINAAETQLKDTQDILQRSITLALYKYYETNILSPGHFYYDVFQQIENVSTYLLTYQDLSPACRHDGLLLQQEAFQWRNISQYFLEIQKINMKYSVFVTFLKTNYLFDAIEKAITEIIVLERAIVGINKNTTI